MRPSAILLRLARPVERNPANDAAVIAALEHVHRVVRDIGPCTTQTLHVTLHKPASAPLPSQAPANTPPPKDPRLRRRPARTPQADSSNGDPVQWSTTFLKRRVLAHLVADGALIKLARDKYTRVAGQPIPPQEKGQDGESNFVWMDKARWDELVQRAGRQGKEGPPGVVQRELDKLKQDEGSSAPWSE